MSRGLFDFSLFFAPDIGVVVVAAAVLAGITARGRGYFGLRLVLSLCWLAFLAWLDWQLIVPLYEASGRFVSAEGIVGEIVFGFVWLSPALTTIVGTVLTYRFVKKKAVLG